jgi:hypothetical protein
MLRFALGEAEQTRISLPNGKQYSTYSKEMWLGKDVAGPRGKSEERQRHSASQERGREGEGEGEGEESPKMMAL